jgi:hypothetical protein
MVQFVPFRKYKNDFKGFANSLLEEITVNIKDYFVDRKIYPNPRKKKKKQAGKELHHVAHI